MKRSISWALVLVMVLSLFAGCASEAEPTTPAPTAAPEAPTEAVAAADDNVENAIAFLKTYYKGAGGATPNDFQRLGTIRVADVPYEVVYTVDCDESVVKIVKGEDGNVTIDVNESCDADVPYVLTATITGTDGKSASLTWEHVVPATMSSEDIINAAYALENGAELGYDATLTGIITSIDTPYSDQYKNVTVTIVVPGFEDKPIQCYRLKGEGADKLVPGDTITVTGMLKNYNGTIEFDAGGNLDTVEKTGTAIEAPSDPAEIVAAAFELAEGESLPYEATLTGEIVAFDGGFSEQYGNVTVTIRVEGKKIVCFRMKGEGANSLHINDTITVTGVIKNYKGTVEFDAGCKLVEVVDGTPPTGPKDVLEHIDAAYELLPGLALDYPTTLTGTIVSVDTPYSDNYMNVTVTIVVPGREDKPVQCFRMKGDDAANVGVNDVITVKGWLMNYNGKVEFAASCRLLEWVDIAEPEIPTDPTEIVNAAYALAEGESLPYEATLTGVITSVDTAYSDKYGNVTVTIVVNGMSDKPIQCFRLKGEGADVITVGDYITVSGTLKNYKGTIEFDAGCSLDAYTKPEEEKPTAPATFAEMVAEAAKLEGSDPLPYTTVQTGVVTEVTYFNEKYNSYSFILDVNGVSVEAYSMSVGEGQTIEAGDTVTISGALSAFKGKVQFSYKHASITELVKA